MYTRALLAALTGVCAIVTSESLAEPPKSALSEPKSVLQPAPKSALQPAPRSALEPRDTSPVKPLDTPVVKPIDKPAVEPLNKPVVDVESRTELSVPIADRDAKIYNQDDHLHYTPDKAFALFESLDADGDRRLSSKEINSSNLDFSSKEFKKVDTDGSGFLDREEFVGIGPDLTNDYGRDALR